MSYSKGDTNPTSSLYLGSFAIYFLCPAANPAVTLASDDVTVRLGAADLPNQNLR